MHKLLENTHREEYIKYLKARDYYFDKARNLNNWKNRIMVFPTIIMIVYYLTLIVLYFIKLIVPAFDYSGFENFMDSYFEIGLGLLTIAIFFLCNAMDDTIAEKKEISNMIREEYDHKLFGFKRNPFVYNYNNIDEYLEKAKYMPSDYNNWKYEYWYDEIFCDNIDRNIICMQMDNVIYTYQIYEAYLKGYKKQFRNIIILMIILMLFSYCFISTSMTFLVFLAFFEWLQVKLEEITTSKEMIATNKNLKEIIMDESMSDVILNDLNYYIHCIEDCIINNRKNGLFVSQKIRNNYLGSTSTYYKELDTVKAKFMDQDTVAMPECAEDITILSHDEKKKYSLDSIHNRLRTMLFNVLEILEQNGIDYVLDGGTLIGAVRKNCSGVKADATDNLDYENGKFLFWDDDVDIAIPVAQLGRAKLLIKNLLNDKYVLQDYENDSFYSPRLSNFRIRELNTASCVGEKDSPLWEKYRYKGLFIDVYAYSPVLYNVIFDSLYRKYIIHPLHKKLWDTEQNWKYTDNSKRMEKRFLRQKKRYLRRVALYEKHAGNTAYYSYMPNYIVDLNKPGPYVKGNALWGEKRISKLEGRSCRIPSNPVEILAAFYGDKWYQSVFSSQSDLREKYGEKWYSMATHKTSVMKHIRHIDLF